jgi:hypothetical protein
MDSKYNGTNGHLDLGVFSTKQEQRFESLEAVLRDGFNGVTAELKALREQGYIPVSVVEKITEQQRNIIHPVIRTLCYSMIVVILWFTGFKAALPHIFNQ